MSIATLILTGLQLSMFVSVLAIGMRVEPADLRYLLSKPVRLAWSLLSMYVFAPLITIVVCKLFSLHPAVIVALVTLAIAPVGALFSQTMLPLVTTGHFGYARGLFFASTLLSVVLTPLAVEVIQAIFGGDVHVSPLAVAQVVISSVLLPLGIGLAIGHRWRSARRWIPALQKMSSLVLLICAVMIIAGTLSPMALVARTGTITVIALITLAGLAVGHFIGGPDEDDRTVLAFATVSRHPGVAMVVASLADQPLAPLGVLLAVLVSDLAVVPYKIWRKRQHPAEQRSTSVRH